MIQRSRLIRRVPAFESAGVPELALASRQTDAERVRDDLERVDRDVMAAFA